MMFKIARFIAWMFIVVTLAVRCTDGLATSELKPSESARELFQNYQNRLYQIRTIDKASGSKSSIGSAFAVNQHGILATNYHVISSYILEPTKYQIEAIDYEGNSEAINVLQIDVINDLALVGFTNKKETDFLTMAAAEPSQGERIYSLGNPRDLGMTVVPGTFNGRTAHSYYDRVLFSGSINPGMSGGPVLNQFGEVIGVNVATSGNQISFLVPLARMKSLLALIDQTEQSLTEQAYQQLIANQNNLMNNIFSGNWKNEPLGDIEVVGEVTDFLSCWGESNSGQKDKFKEVFRRCNNKEYVYLAPDFYTGVIELEFFLYDTKQLNQWQFYRMLGDAFSNMSAGNVASEKHVTEFSCQSEFTQAQITPELHKAIYCVRNYKRFPRLYDVLFLSATVSEESQSLVTHYTLSGIEKVHAQEFLKRFLEQIK